VKQISIFSILVFVLASQISWAEVPRRTMSYQGILTDGSSIAVSDGTYSLTFSIYDVETLGAHLWTETHPSVMVANGVFYVILGSITPLNIAFDQQYWLGIAVGPNPEMTPRIQLTAAAYSLDLPSAETHDHGGETWTGDGTGTGLTLENYNIGLSASVGEAPAGPGGSDFGSSFGNPWPPLDGPAAMRGRGYYGVYGYSPNYYGIYGRGYYGVYGGGTYGVYGYGNGTVTTYGVYGYGNGTGNNYGVYGKGSTYGVYGHGTGMTGIGLYASGTTWAARFRGGIEIQNVGTGSTTAHIDYYGDAYVRDVYCSQVIPTAVQVYSGSGNTCVVGDEGYYIYNSSYTPIGWWCAYIGQFATFGTKLAVVPTMSYGRRGLYVDESTEVRFFDRGEGQLVNGEVTIELDPIFLETVTIDQANPMLVQVTLTSDCNGVYVAERTSTSFTVRELGGGTSDAGFIWEVGAKRKGYEDKRLEEASGPPVTSSLRRD